MSEKTLLILDLDETIMHASETLIGTTCDFELEQYHVYKRPHIKEFFNTIKEFYNIAIWSSAIENYAFGVVNQLSKESDSLSIENLEFLWARNHCTPMQSKVQKDGYYLKDLAKVEEEGYNLDRLLMVDDETRKLHRNYDNAIFIEPFYGDAADSELIRLAKYLIKIKDISNLRDLEKRFWDREV